MELEPYRSDVRDIMRPVNLQYDVAAPEGMWTATELALADHTVRAGWTEQQVDEEAGTTTWRTVAITAAHLVRIEGRASFPNWYGGNDGDPATPHPITVVVMPLDSIVGWTISGIKLLGGFRPSSEARHATGNYLFILRDGEPFPVDVTRCNNEGDRTRLESVIRLITAEPSVDEPAAK